MTNRVMTAREETRNQRGSLGAALYPDNEWYHSQDNTCWNEPIGICNKVGNYEEDDPHDQGNRGLLLSAVSEKPQPGRAKNNAPDEY